MIFNLKEKYKLNTSNIINDLCNDYSYTRPSNDFNTCYNDTTNIKLDVDNHKLIINKSNSNIEIDLSIIKILNTCSLHYIISYYDKEQINNLIDLIINIIQAGYDTVHISYCTLTFSYKKFFKPIKMYRIDLDLYRSNNLISIRYLIGNKTISSYNSKSIIKEGIISK